MLFRETRQIMICVSAIVIISGFVLFGYLPLRKQIKAIKQQKTMQQITIAKGISERDQLPVLKEQLLELRKKIGNYEAIVTVGRNLGEFLETIANLMKEQNLKEQMIAPGEEITIGQLNCIPINIQCKGRLKQIFEFYKQLQQLNRLIRIQQVKLHNDSDFSGQISMQTKAVIYYRTNATEG